MKLNHVILTVPDVMGWSEVDTLALTQWLNAYANLLGNSSEEQAVQMVRNALALEGDFPTYDMNRWFHTVISLMFYELLSILQECDAAKNTNLEQLEKSFSPSINYAASRFNNCFDGIDFEQGKEKIVEQMLQLLEKL